MVRTQIQIPDDVYQRAKEFCRRKEMSLAELCRRSLEQYLVQWPELTEVSEWQLPALSLGEFKAPVSEWRALANEPEQA